MTVNKVILLGNLGADPEIRHTQDGRPIANLRLATSERWKSKDGEQKERTEWHRVVIFNEGLCRIAEQYLRKGSTIYIEGQLQTRKWQDQQGADKFSTEIVLQGFNAVLKMLGGKKDQSAHQQPNSGYNQPQGGYSEPQGGMPDLDDDIPF